MTWAMDIPATSLENPAARHVLLCMANYAGPEGRGAFPSAATISKQTGLSERTVRAKLDELEKAGWIAEGNQAIAAAYIDRRDRRPVVYDLQLKRGANAAPRKERGADAATGCSSKQNGVQENAERGAAAAPNTSLNHQVNQQQPQREISDVADAQDRQALEGMEQSDEARQRVSMFADWQPDEQDISAQLKFVGLLPDALTQDVLNTFKGFHIAKPDIRDNAAGWCYRLARWIKRDLTQKVSAAPADDDDTSWANDLGAL